MGFLELASDAKHDCKRKERIFYGLGRHFHVPGTPIPTLPPLLARTIQDKGKGLQNSFKLKPIISSPVSGKVL